VIIGGKELLSLPIIDRPEGDPHWFTVPQLDIEQES
jgi:hypothetical protein